MATTNTGHHQQKKPLVMLRCKVRGGVAHTMNVALAF